jgi:hypothetical protein
MTILQFVNRCRRKLKTKPVASLTDTSGHWTAEDLLDIYNDVADTFCEEIKCLRETSTQSAVADQREYDFDSDWVDIIGVWYDNEPLFPFSVDELDFLEQYQGLDSPWRDKTATAPYGWYLSENTGKYGLIDTPNANDTDAITIWHTINPDHFTTASTATTELLNGHGHLKPYHPALVYYAVAECEEEDGNQAKADVYRRKADRIAAKAKLKIKYPKHTLPSMMSTKANKAATIKRFWTA